MYFDFATSIENCDNSLLGIEHVGGTVNEFCHTVLRACSAKETVHAGLLVDFLKAALPLLQSKIIASICEALLRLFSLAAVRSPLILVYFCIRQF